MLRVFVSIVLPLVLPTALYLAWLWIARGAARGGGMLWGDLPWVWLVGGGVLLLAAALVLLTEGFGSPPSGVYVPPRWENGRIVPGHIAPGPSR
ncbi:MAG TPA: DUF6111 family protein [Stellaceae bacterium]|nr:DUF6111 family protein [Stellaceae bacterium]